MLMYAVMETRPLEATRGRGSVGREIAEGLAFVRQNELFAAFMGLVFWSSLFGMSFQLFLPVFARDLLQVGSEGFGFMQAAVGAGAILGSLAAARWVHAGQRGQRALVGAALFGLLVIAFAWSRSFPLSLGVMGLIGLTNAFYMITISTTLQLLVPDPFRGRVMGLWSLSYTLPPLGGTFTGWMAESVGTPVAVSIGGLLVIGAALGVGMLRPRVRNLD
jgi:MFS family permease